MGDPNLAMYLSYSPWAMRLAQVENENPEGQHCYTAATPLLQGSSEPGMFANKHSLGTILQKTPTWLLWCAAANILLTHVLAQLASFISVLEATLLCGAAVLRTVCTLLQEQCQGSGQNRIRKISLKYHSINTQEPEHNTTSFSIAGTWV